MITNRLKSSRETSLLESCPAERKSRGGEHQHNATMYLVHKKNNVKQNDNQQIEEK